MTIIKCKGFCMKAAVLLCFSVYVNLIVRNEYGKETKILEVAIQLYKDGEVGTLNMEYESTYRVSTMKRPEFIVRGV
jgi:hypothetical protein